eukprot:2092733-Pyramimonas_sp.AAC.1
MARVAGAAAGVAPRAHPIYRPVLDAQGAALVVRERVGAWVLLERASLGFCRRAVALGVLLLDCGNDAPLGGEGHEPAAFVVRVSGALRR